MNLFPHLSLVFVFFDIQETSSRVVSCQRLDWCKHSELAWSQNLTRPGPTNWSNTDLTSKFYLPKAKTTHAKQCFVFKSLNSGGNETPHWHLQCQRFQSRTFLVIEAFLLTHSANSASEGVGNKAVQCLQSKGQGTCRKWFPLQLACKDFPKDRCDTKNMFETKKGSVNGY